MGDAKDDLKAAHDRGVVNGIKTVIRLLRDEPDEAWALLAERWPELVCEHCGRLACELNHSWARPAEESE
jgi:hypothetical protein